MVVSSSLGSELPRARWPDSTSLKLDLSCSSKNFSSSSNRISPPDMRTVHVCRGREEVEICRKLLKHQIKRKQ